tara:strand:+ start:33 stop:824 length:792 start_codon:yes stop_codon:yes gene_type:complete
MQEVDINSLVDKNNCLIKDILSDIIIVGKIDKLYIDYKYDQLDLSRIECNIIYYFNQKGKSIKNHKLPNSLKLLYCNNNKLTVLPNLPNSLEYLHCNNNQLTSFTDVQLPNSLKIFYICDNQLTSFANTQLPNSLEELYCYNNKLSSLPNLPNSLKYLDCDNNELNLIPYLPNSLENLYCSNNNLSSLPDFSHINHKLTLSLNQDLPISFIPYNKNIKLCDKKDNKIIINDYSHNPITNQDQLDRYMDYIKNHQRNRIKSARN